MDNKILEKIENNQYKNRPDVKVGDTAKLHLKIVEGGKERIQIFEGVVLAIKGTGLSKNLIVRKMSNGVGVEKIVPLHAPILEKVEIVKRGKVRRSKLYYMKTKIGKRAMNVSNRKDIYLTDEVKVEEEKATEEVAE